MPMPANMILRKETGFLSNIVAVKPPIYPETRFLTLDAI
jgi:hypothetical protein